LAAFLPSSVDTKPYSLLIVLIIASVGSYIVRSRHVMSGSEPWSFCLCC